MIFCLVFHERYAFAHNGAGNYRRRKARVPGFVAVNGSQRMKNLVEIMAVLDIDYVPVGCSIVGLLRF